MTDFRNAPQVRIANFYLRWVLLPGLVGIGSSLFFIVNFVDPRERPGFPELVLFGLPGAFLTVIALRKFRASHAKSREDFRRYLNRKR